MAAVSLAQKFAPKISFSDGERFFPCDLFFNGSDISGNKEAYEKLSDDEKKKEGIACYYHIVETNTHAAYQYWYYYAYNEYSGGWTGGMPDTHDHEIECAIVYVKKSSETPVAMALNQHHFRNWVWEPDLELPVYAEKGGHGMFRVKRIPDSWKKGGFETRVLPKKSVEDLRTRFVSPEPAGLIDDDGTIKGQSANLIGMLAKPKVPWVRIPEYTLPISQLFAEAERLKNKLLSEAPKRVQYAIPRAAKAFVRPHQELNLSIPYNKPTVRKNLDEALRLQLITKGQYKALVS